MSLQPKLIAMAEKLIDEANDPKKQMTAKDRVDIFKATTALYLGLRKKGKDDDDGDERPGVGPSFEDLRRHIIRNGTKQ